jgi:hypothetical protein
MKLKFNENFVATFPSWECRSSKVHGRRPMVNTISVAMSKWPTPPLNAIEKDADIYNYKHRNHG